ncbi:acyltransferase [Sporomusa sphaeroides]|uniref:Acetyltransferase n=1 Tax=Sporomusa sphaeroides DSM 2875 TaxID=1337886 RepID=A0A1U7MA90_9FIRM|nr:acyltransferase [Sporomusa sphaeroides]OLS54345.1 putative acetyltransferase [Sporomusa sphaeroides DSM 2875]CVK21574.1 Putative acetyltransferase [Sporomusa sphaeroides DSM 2875]
MLKRIIEFILNFIAASPLLGRRGRYLLYRLCGCNIKTKRISPECIITSNRISIGKHTYINYRCIFDNEDHIEIGEHCFLAQEVLLAGATHPITNRTYCRAGKAYGLPIRIGNGCWIGARVTVLAGVTIGEGTVIAAGSLVNKDCEPNSLYAGVPAKKIKDLPLNGREVTS